jgi:LEA14-like dessication related protein
VYSKRLDGMERKAIRNGALLGLLLLLLASGAAAAAKKDISISLSHKEIKDMDSSGLTLVFYLRVANSSSTPYYLTQYDYRVVVQETDYFSLKTSLEDPIRIQENGSTLISLPVKITYDLLYGEVKGLEGSQKIACYVTGLMVFSDGKRREEKTPFAFPGEFPVFSGLEWTILPVQVKSFSVGGVEFTFSFSCRNRNAFEVALGDLTYRIALAGQSIAEGTIRGENRIESQGERIFSLLLMVDFFETGKELFPVFDQPSVACQLSGEATATSVWGDFNVTLSKDEVVDIQRKQP